KPLFLRRPVAIPVAIFSGHRERLGESTASRAYLSLRRSHTRRCSRIRSVAAACEVGDCGTDRATTANHDVRARTHSSHLYRFTPKADIVSLHVPSTATSPTYQSARSLLYSRAENWRSVPMCRQSKAAIVSSAGEHFE